MSTRQLEDMNEEFNNFMYRVTEVEKIVKKLSSDDKSLQKIGSLEAERYLKENDRILLDSVDEESVILKVKDNRTVINEKAFEDPQDRETMSQEAFMEEVSKDADRRYKSRMIRKEKMETFKKQASLAFRRGDYEKALCCYNKAIEQIKDNNTLYNNRCLTYIRLKLYGDAIKDADLALRLEENNFRSQLLLCKALYLNGDHKDFERVLQEAKDTNGDQLEFIDDFVEKLKIETSHEEGSGKFN